MPCGAEAESIRAEVIARRASSQKAVVERFLRAQREGDLPENVDVEGLTSFLIALLQGMAVQAGAGVPRADLERMIETSLAVWPGC